MNDAAPPAPTTAGMGRGHARLIAAALFVIPLALAPLFPPDDWYAGLRTSRLTPPGWVFGPVWTVLYLLLAIAVQRILVARAARRTRLVALGCFLGQYALNLAWSGLFFGLHAPRTALLALIVMFGLAVAATAVFARIDRGAALLLAPYLPWLGYATWLNAAVVALNPA